MAFGKEVKGRKFYIIIDEEQLGFISTALDQHNPLTLRHEVHEELNLLRGMFKDLIDNKDEDPEDTDHDFTA